MADALKCDRCGKFYSHYGNLKEEKRDDFSGKKVRINAIAVFNKDIYGTHRDITRADICPECKNSFLEWWSRWQILTDNNEVK